MPVPSKTPSGTAGAIVLVESYSALAAAITAALRKFAPAYTTHVAESLREAEKIAAVTSPALIIVDFDPPDAEALDTFMRLQKILPAARVLIITAGAPHEALRARPQPCAFQFIEKPFELAEFGAAIQTLISEPAQGAANLSRGSLRDLHLLDAIPLLCLAADASTTIVHASGKRPGAIHVENGKITHASTARSQGIDALEQMLTWPAPRFASGPAQPTTPRSIRAPWHGVLLDLINSIPLPEKPNSPEPGVVVAPVAVRPTKKIVVIDDTEMLRVFVEEVLTTADPRITVVTSSDARDGLRQVRATLPDLVLLDYSLPDSNGDEVCRALLEREETARTPIIMMSGHVPEMTAAASKFPNIVATLAKPFLSAALIDLVAATLADPPETTPPPSGKPALPAAVEAAPSPAIAPPMHNGNDLPAASDPPPPSAVQSEAAAPAPFVAQPPPRVAQAMEPLRVLPAPAAATPLEAARIAAARSNAVIIGMLLEVVSMQFSAGLQMVAIRARPCSSTVSLHVDPSALGVSATPDAGFELQRVDLDARGHIRTIRLVPAANVLPATVLPSAVPIGSVVVLAEGSGGAMELTPAAAAPMKIELLAAFELAGVELSANFSVACLVLQSRAARMRISLQPGAARAGATFEAAQVLLDRSARIAEILLDAVA